MSTEAEIALARRAIALLDLTELGDHASEADVAKLCAKAKGDENIPPVAAVCVWPRHVAHAKAALAGTGIRIATVVNFPSGEETLPDVLALMQAALEAGADEIDLVMPWRAFLADDEEKAAAMICGVKAALPADRRLKVILESGGYPDASSIRRAADLAIRCGAHFIKTSTGKSGTGATLEAARVMLNAILAVPRNVGLKPSGGIRSFADAGAYLALADDVMGPGWTTPETFRFGASGLHDALAAVITGGESHTSSKAY
ncbi:MAG: deoxyribose-phosphate aldolase [Beijerinckiaceae bacterium]|jgi:deoxyribose-phosphate aldolase|nr:deoxyribose-phosphate aldolase [Beijerinckiaceae bacterium]